MVDTKMHTNDPVVEETKQLMSDSNLFAQWLRDRRKALRLTQTELAARAGLSFSAVQKLEGGQRRPSQQVAQLLAEVLKVPPKDRSAFLHLAMDTQGAPSADGAQDAQPTNLPAQLTQLIGRDAELEAISALLRSDRVRLLTLTGPPGIGKTRLGLHVASNLKSYFSQGVFFVSLVPLRNPAMVMPTLAAMLGVRDNGTEPISLTLKEYLREQKMLLVLDNFEQVVEAAPAVADLLWGCPQVKMLVTSREALHVRGENRYQVPSLDRDAAVQLFVERARQAVADFSLTKENEGAVAEICARMEGVPLAIELVAARVKLLPPKALLERLVRHGTESRSGMLPMLIGGQRDLPARHRTLRSAIAWSHDLLNGEQRALFARLGVFVGGFTLSSVEAVCNAAQDLSASTLDSIESLFDKGLIRFESEAGGGADAEPRYTMLETIREYAAERLEERGEADAVRGWHIEYFLALARSSALQVLGKDQARWMLALDREADNIRAALRWAIDTGRMEMAAPTGVALANYWYASGKVSEGQSWLEEMAEHEKWKRVPLRLQAELLSELGYLVGGQSDLEQAKRYLDKSLALLRQTSDPTLLLLTLQRLGVIELFAGNYERADSLLREVLSLHREEGDPRRVGMSVHTIALVSLFRGDYRQAELLEEEAIELLRDSGDMWHIGLLLSILGLALCRSGQVERAEQVCKEALTILADVESSSHPVGLVKVCMAEIARDRGDRRAAMSLYRDALQRLSEAGSFPSTAFALVGLASLLAAEGEVDRSALVCGALEGNAARLKAEPVAPCNKLEYEETLACVRASLSEAEFSTVWARGYAMSAEEVIAFALDAAD